MVDLKIVPFGGGSTPTKEADKEPSVFARFVEYINALNDQSQIDPDITEALHNTPNLFFSLSGNDHKGRYNFFHVIENYTADPYLFPSIIKEQCRTALMQHDIERMNDVVD